MSVLFYMLQTFEHLCSVSCVACKTKVIFMRKTHVRVFVTECVWPMQHISD